MKMSIVLAFGVSSHISFLPIAPGAKRSLLLGFKSVCSSQESDAPLPEHSSHPTKVTRRFLEDAQAPWYPTQEGPSKLEGGRRSIVFLCWKSPQVHRPLLVGSSTDDFLSFFFIILSLSFYSLFHSFSAFLCLLSFLLLIRMRYEKKSKGDPTLKLRFFFKCFKIRLLTEVEMLRRVKGGAIIMKINSGFSYNPT